MLSFDAYIRHLRAGDYSLGWESTLTISNRMSYTSVVGQCGHFLCHPSDLHGL